MTSNTHKCFYKSQDRMYLLQDTAYEYISLIRKVDSIMCDVYLNIGVNLIHCLIELCAQIGSK